MKWSTWKLLDDNWAPTPRSLQETLDGGQAFRWKFLEDENLWQGIFGSHLCQLKQDSVNNKVSIRGYQWKAKDYNAANQYFGCKIPWTQIDDSLPWRSDAHLKACMDSFPELRILRQPFAETLLAFMCSATKRIPQIKVMCQNLATELGNEIAPNTHALPTWEQVAQADETSLRKLALGFRAKNIKKTADIIAATPDLLQQVEDAPYDEAKELLLQLPGVGEKIADCALLFGTTKQEAFPVDTWVIKVLSRRYGLDAWSNTQLSAFGRIHFGKNAGFAQQYLFSWERAFG